MTMPWRLSWRADPVGRDLADRHYNRQKIGAAQFVPPGRCLVLVGTDTASLWITSWPFAEYVRHGFEPDGETEGGLLAFRMTPDRMPPPALPVGASLSLFGGGA